MVAKRKRPTAIVTRIDFEIEIELYPHHVEEIVPVRRATRQHCPKEEIDSKSLPISSMRTICPDKDSCGQ